MSVHKGSPISIYDKLREAYTPRGTDDLSYIHMDSGCYDRATIYACIVELEKMPSRVALGELPSELEKFAYHILMRGAHLK